MWKSDFSTYFDTIDVKKLRLFQGYFSRVNRYKFWNRQVAGLPTICLFFNLAKLQCKQTVVTDFCIGFANKIHIIYLKVW